MAQSKVLDAINEQINYELYSANLYLAMSAYFSDLGLGGFAKWMKAQYKEELFHAEKMFDYVIARGGRATIKALDEPPSAWKSALAVLEEGLKHEKFVSSRINNLVDLAMKEKDHASTVFLQWFVTEQVEEEENFTDLVGQLKLIKGEGQGLLMLDRELATRVFTLPAAPAAD